VGTDLVFWLRALLDSADEIAWLAVWKHPSIGLSDAGIARARAGSGVFAIDAQTSEIIEAPAWMRSLGHLAEAECLDAPHSEADIAAFQHAAPLLRHARTQMDRSETSEILDVLATRLHWRTVLAAGPGGDDDLAQLEVALDWIRSLSGEGMSDEEIARVIADASHADPPQVPLSRTQRHIACTTVFQAKGRAWDHVCVTSPGRGARKDPTDDASTTWITLGTARRVRLVGLKFDPTGGLSPFKDPLGRLASAILRERFNEECARLAYVAVTRAKRTVTTGIPRPRDMYMPGQLQKLLATAWGRATLEDPGIARVIRDRPPQHDLAPTGWAREDPRGKLHHDEPMERRTWQERQPSSAGAHLSAEERQQRADRIANLVRLANGLHVGSAPIDPPEDAHGHLFARDWGQIAHGWFAMWRFRGSPTPADVAAWLQSEWGRSPEDVQSWLLSLSQSLPERSGALWTLVTDPASTLHFEYPLVGVGRGQDQDLLLSGRIDLLVERKRQLTVIDFKAGSRSPSGWADLVAQGGLKNYGPQLDAYRDTLENLGQSVESVALWFVRTGTTVRW
jgi:ATP-dependent exoDNAse (exonuclease V) beta subunit